VKATDDANQQGQDDSNAPFSIFQSVTAVTEAVPTEFALSAAWPNPTRGPLSVVFAVAREANVRLSLADIQGREVLVLATGDYRPGRYQVAWDGLGTRGPVRTGMYFLRLSAAGQTFTKRVVVSR
jgi:hypothetical protein